MSKWGTEGRWGYQAAVPSKSAWLVSKIWGQYQKLGGGFQHQEGEEKWSTPPEVHLYKASCIWEGPLRRLESDPTSFSFLCKGRGPSYKFETVFVVTRNHMTFINAFFVCLFDSTWMWECEKKDLDLSKICNSRTVVPQYHTLHTWIAASLSPVLFGSIRLYRRRDLSTLMTALYLLPRKEAPRTRRVQIHQTFLKKYRTLFYALLTLVCLQCTCQQMCETQSLRKKVNHYGQKSQFNLINTYWVFFTKLLRT